LIGMRCSGKSFVTRDLLKTIGVDNTTVISPTEKLNKFYGDFIDNHIYYKYDSDLIDKLIDENREQKLVLDDCIGYRSIKDQTFNNLVYNSKQYKITTILASQYSKFTPNQRANFDYIILFAEDFISNKKKLWQSYAGFFPTFEIFDKLFTELTKDHSCMVIDNRTKGSIEDKVFWFKSDNSSDTESQCSLVIDNSSDTESQCSLVIDNSSDTESAESTDTESIVSIDNDIVEYDFIDDLKTINICDQNNNNIKVSYDDATSVNIIINNYYK
jgi:hypothetical protein